MTARKLLNGTESSFGSDQSRIVEMWHVDGITSADDHHIDALNAPELPKMNQSHSKSRYAIVVRQEPVPIDNTQAYVRITYETPAGGSAGVPTGQIRRWVRRQSCVVAQEMTERTAGPSFDNPFGDPIKVEYLPNGGSQPIIRVPKVPRYRGHRILSFEITGKDLFEIPDEVYDYAGCINGSDWREKPPRYWLFAGVSDSYDGKRWTHRLEFWGNRLTWDQYAVFRQPDDQIPPDVVIQELSEPPEGGQDRVDGLTRANVQNLLDFSQVFGFLDTNT